MAESEAVSNFSSRRRQRVRDTLHQNSQNSLGRWWWWHLLPFDDPSIEIWACNESYNADYLKNTDGDFRIDRWFQVHLEEDWSRVNNPNDPRHPEWLSLNHNFPIYMQEKFDGIPNSVKIPMDEMNEEFFSNAFSFKDAEDSSKFTPWIELWGEGYYTSSFALMMATAIYLKKDPIQIWGFNMGTHSEWMYQKPGGEFWVAMALGRGIDVQIAANSPIMQGSVYGYETANVLLPAQVRERLKLLQTELPPLKEATLQYHGARLELEDIFKDQVCPDDDTIKLRLETRTQAELASSCKTNFYIGSTSEAEVYLKYMHQRHEDTDEATGFVDRLTLEVRIHNLRTFIEHLRARMENRTGAKNELQRLVDTLPLNEVPEIIIERLIALKNSEVEAANELNFYLGAVSQTEEFMFRSESRSPDVSTNYDFGFIIVPELKPESTDILEWEMEADQYGSKKKEVEEEDEGAANGDTELHGDADERPASESPVRGFAYGVER